ncbi:MAG: arginase family protein [Thermoanaerobaculia bacterium]
MAALDLIRVPYDCGRRDVRLGLGPRALVDGGVRRSLEEAGHEVLVRSVELDGDGFGEVPTAVALQGRTVGAVREALEGGRLPVIFAGNCHLAALGALGALERPAVLWLDAHGDLNTPETSSSGYFDGMSLAVVTGRCYRGLASRLEGFTPLSDEAVALLGARDLDPGEAEILERSAISRLGVDDLDRLPGLLARWAADRRSLYLHLDLDVLDPEVLVCNPWAAAGGLRRDGLLEVMRSLHRALPPVILGVTAYGPDFDRSQRGPGLVAEALGRLLARA